MTAVLTLFFLRFHCTKISISGQSEDDLRNKERTLEATKEFEASTNRELMLIPNVSKAE